MGSGPAPLLLDGCFSPGAAEAGLPGIKEGASWLQALGLSRRQCEADATGKGLSQSKVPGEKQSHFLISPAEVLHDLPWGTYQSPQA